MFRAIVAALLVPAAVFFASGALAAAPRSASPSAVSLRVSDLPAGYSLYSGGKEAAQAAAPGYGVGAKQMLAHGFLAGYQVAYRHGGSSAGVIAASTVYLFRSRDGARWVMPYEVESAERSKQTTAHTIRAPIVGEASVGLSLKLTKSKASGYAVIFRRGPYLVAAIEFGTGRLATLAAVMSMARAVDSHIRTSH